MELRISNLIEFISAGGVDRDTARARVSSYAQSRLICFKAGTNTSPNIYRAEDAGVAIMLSALQDCGVADREILESVTVDAYLRIDRCLAGLARGESWSLVIDIHRGTLGRFINARLVRGDETPSQSMPVDFNPRGAIVVVLDDMLQPVVRRLRAQRQH